MTDAEKMKLLREALEKLLDGATALMRANDPANAARWALQARIDETRTALAATAESAPDFNPLTCPIIEGDYNGPHGPLPVEKCPGPDCKACNGEACEKCGKGCWNDAAPTCEHDTLEQHEPAPSARDMRVAEAVREACARHIAGVVSTLSNWSDVRLLGRVAQDTENMDLAAIVAGVRP